MDSYDIKELNFVCAHEKVKCMLNNFTWKIGDTMTENFYHHQILFCRNCAFEILPHKLFEYFENLESVILTGSELSTIAKDDFFGANNLNYLNISYNLIEKLDDSVFSHASELKYIDLSNNQISKININAFQKLKNLAALYLHNNQIVKIPAIPNTVTILRLDYNKIDTISFTTDTFQVLALNNNQIKEIPGNNHIGYYFDFSSNPIDVQNPILVSAIFLKQSSINIKTCVIVKNVKGLDVSFNRISTVIVNSADDLTELNLSHDNLIEIKNLTILKNLQKLDLSFNQIHDIDSSSFSKMTNLQSLNLEKSGLKMIEYGFLSYQTDLTFLDISYNNLGNINFTNLSSLKNLKWIYVDGNQINRIDEIEEFHNMFPALLSIGLDDNDFHCDLLTEIVKELSTYSIEIIVDEKKIVKSIDNDNGIACNSTLNSTTIHFEDTFFSSNITDNINEIETESTCQTLRFNSDNSTNQQQEIIKLKNAIESISTDFVDLKVAIEQMNKTHFEYFQLLLQQKTSDKNSNLKNSLNESESEIVQSLKTSKFSDNSNNTIERSSDSLINEILIFLLCISLIAIILVILYSKKVSRYLRESRWNLLSSRRSSINNDDVSL